jgi:hypothetical protein
VIFPLALSSCLQIGNVDCQESNQACVHQVLDVQLCYQWRGRINIFFIFLILYFSECLKLALFRENCWQNFKKKTFFKREDASRFSASGFSLKLAGHLQHSPLIPFRFRNFPRYMRKCPLFTVSSSSLRERKIFWIKMFFFY